MNRRVTIPDIVASTGLSLAAVSTTLNDLAYELGADLDVTDTGQIYYKFPPDLHYRYFSNRLLNFLHRIWTIISPYLLFLFRISFGLILLCSITLIFLIMLVLQSMVCAFSGNTTEVLNLMKDFFYLIKRLNVFSKENLQIKTTDDQDEVDEKQSTENPQDKGFLLNCHALLFGPKDPNRNFQKNKSKAIAQLIRMNNGIVLPEQLAPLTGAAADELEGAFPVLATFHGIPGATNSGHLLYKFPEMQVATSHESVEQPPPTIKMQPRVFAELGMETIKPILLVAGSNFLGTVFFWWLLFAVRSSEDSTQNLFLVLAIYATFFLFFPAFRWIYVQLKNRQIKRYNEKIDRLEQSLVQPSEALKLAEKEVEKIRAEEVAQLTDKLAYTTSRDYLEQEAEQLEAAERPFLIE